MPPQRTIRAACVQPAWILYSGIITSNYLLIYLSSLVRSTSNQAGQYGDGRARGAMEYSQLSTSDIEFKNLSSGSGVDMEDNNLDPNDEGR